MTLATMIAETRQILGEPDSANSRFTDAQLTTWANLAYDAVIAETEEIPITERSYTTPAGATPTVTLNANTITVNRAKIYVRPDNQWQELEVKDLDWLIKADPDWENADVGIPTHLIRMGTFSARLYPPPNTSIESQATSLKTYGLEKPTNLSDSTDLPDLPVLAHNLFPHFMAYRGFSYLGDNDRSVSELRLFRGMLKDVKWLLRKFSDQRTRFRFLNAEV